MTHGVLPLTCSKYHYFTIPLQVFEKFCQISYEFLRSDKEVGKQMFIPDVIKLAQGIHVTVIIKSDYDMISHSSHVFGKA